VQVKTNEIGRAAEKSAAPRVIRVSPIRAYLCAASLVVLTLSACAKPQVMALAPPPPLEVPVVPPRLVGPVVVEEPTVPPVEEPEPAPPRTPRTPRPVARPAAGNDPVTKVEPPPEAAAKPPDATTGQAASTGSSSSGEPAPLLRTPDTANDAEVVKEVRDTLARAGDNLSKVNYNGLNPGAKAQHDTARRFITQAEDALKGKNLVFARYVANKAENISASLLNR
jgi:outer membrane biosynthesis protein TonB